MKQIYLDSDDEITAIIGKLETLESETVALIPPKRSTTLQSVVNLKLLKKAAEAGDVTMVLITRDPGILNVASQLKLLTAPNLETEPVVPEAATQARELPSDTIDGSQPSESDLSSADTAAAKVKKSQPAPGEKPKKIKGSNRVPDFDRFKKWALLGLAALILLGGGVWALFNLLPGADVSIQARTQETSIDFEMTLDASADESDIEAAILAAESRQVGRTLTTTFDATGERTVGERATGQVTISNCQNSTGITIESGTTVTAANGRAFRTTQSVSVPGGTFTPQCSTPGTASVPVEAEEIGPGHNIRPSTYTVAGYSSSNVSGQGGNMTGGSEEQVSVVSEADVRGAREELLKDERSAVIQELRQQFGDEHFILEASFRSNVSSATSEPSVGEDASSGRLILQVSYTMLAVDAEEFDELLESRHLLAATEGDGLAAIETGLEEVTVSDTDDALMFRVETDGIVGPDIDTAELAAEISGMSYREAIDYIEAMPNVTRVQIDLSPFWASNVPGNTDRINIEFDIDGVDADDSSD